MADSTKKMVPAALYGRASLRTSTCARYGIHILKDVCIDGVRNPKVDVTNCQICGNTDVIFVRHEYMDSGWSACAVHADEMRRGMLLYMRMTATIDRASLYDELISNGFTSNFTNYRYNFKPFETKVSISGEFSHNSEYGEWETLGRIKSGGTCNASLNSLFSKNESKIAILLAIENFITEVETTD